MTDYLAMAKEWERRREMEKSAVNTADIIHAIYNGTFKGAALLPVLPEYQAILGAACWVCSDIGLAERKRRTEKELVFTVPELKATVDTAAAGMDKLKGIIAVKQAFRGVVVA